MLKPTNDYQRARESVIDTVRVVREEFCTERTVCGDEYPDDVIEAVKALAKAYDVLTKAEVAATRAGLYHA